jgi:histone H3/H4
MKLDPDNTIVQNEAAIMTTMAAEMFLTKLARESQKMCKTKERNTIRYVLFLACCVVHFYNC